jgi:predicted nucleic acid-binding protein
MGHYLDTNVIVSMIMNDTHTIKAAAWFDRTEPVALVSTFAKAEFAVTISRNVRSRRLSAAEGRTALDIFDRWLDGDAQLVNVSSDDIESADRLVRDFAAGSRRDPSLRREAARRDADHV